MGFQIQQAQMDALLQLWKKDYEVYAPKRFEGSGTFSDTDCIRYGAIQSIGEVVFEEKSHYSFKEILMPVTQTLFFFTENEMMEADPAKKGAVIFLRSCDLHALKRLDEMYLHNGPEDYYYSRLRSKIKIVLMGCSHSFSNCFCASMGTNRSEHYDLGINARGKEYFLDCREPGWEKALRGLKVREQEVVPDFVAGNEIEVKIPENLSARVASSKMWDQYDSRCINCGRCNFACPTCTCFTMQDLFYTENGKAGERRRVWASCMVDGFTDVAGGGSYRRRNGERMRFKVLHKVRDFHQRNGYHMCVGCGRCDDICPEYISFSGCINRLEAACKEGLEANEK